MWRGNPKTTTEQRQEICELYSAKTCTVPEIAARFGITDRQVRRISRIARVAPDERYWTEKPCAQCGKTWKVRKKYAEQHELKFCDRNCWNAYVRNPDYIRSQHHMKLARTVVKRFFWLEEGHVVHHIDGNNLNNDIANLMVFKTPGDHSKWHWKPGSVVPLFDGSSPGKDKDPVYRTER